jgi:hypothetical protein
MRLRGCWGYYVVLEGGGGLRDEVIFVEINLVSDMDGQQILLVHFFSFYWKVMAK